MKTIKVRDNLNGIKACDLLKRGDYYTVLCLEDVDNIYIHNDIINESILRDEIIQELFNHCIKNDKTLMSVEEVMSKIPANNKWYKILERSKSHEHRLYVDICDFSGTSFYDELKYFSKNKIPNNILINKAIQLSLKFTEHTDGGFVTFDNHKEFGILFLNSKIGKNIFTFKHELIHYFNWVKGAFKHITIADDTFYAEEIKVIRTYINENFCINDFTYMTSSDEYENLLNNFLDLLKNIKIIYFNDMNSYNFARKIVDILMIKESSENYCKRYLLYDDTA